MKLTFKILAVFIALCLLLLVTRSFWQARLVAWYYAPTTTVSSEPVPTPTAEPTTEQAQTIASDLEVPWEIVFLLDGSLLVTERPGRLVQIATDGTRQTFPIAGVYATGEGGLLGLTLHPDFSQNHLLYLYYTTQTNGRLENRVVRYLFQNQVLTAERVILDQLPAGQNHNGGRLAFGPEGDLYITTGETGQSDLAQDTTSLAGKILRVTAEGEFPADNPFGNAVYSYGHRNPQGLAWDNQGRLWSTEHGRSGASSGLDELNLIVKGANYGWPIIQGDAEQSGMQKPVINSGPNTTWAPAGLVYAEGSLFFAGLRGQTLYEYKLNDATPTLVTHFVQQFGRLRALKLSPQGTLYFSTSNRDGRGQALATDDRILEWKL